MSLSEHAYTCTCAHMARAKDARAKMDQEAVAQNHKALVKTITATNVNDFIHS